ncbi:hypothetical protein D9615_009222 [Tricholomella constricta]|uniref:C2 domain-containing protein n=1 Tax=Tricholomella constricta TaxID=117010 RepID=A0A8H5H2G3_9AGAR|nr:hypothetical protein D9615_009222 [Tricholomella constricta]
MSSTSTLSILNIQPVIKASDVQSKFHDVKCYVSITIGSGPAQTTKAVRSAHPIWNEILSFEAHPSSAVTIEIIRRSKFFGTHVIAKLADSDVSIPPECFERDLEQTYNLKSSANRTQLVVLWSAAGTDAASPGAGATTDTEVTPDVKASPVESSLMPTEEKSMTAQDTVSTLQGLDTMVGHAHPGAFRDSGTHTRLATVIGYVGILVNLGDAIAEAHPIANAAWKVLTASQKILQGQIERDEKVQQLWGTIVDTLDFMKDAEPLDKIRGLEKTTEAIVSQLYNCVLHLKKYEERGFLLRTVAGALNPTADAALEEFITSFTDLRVKFDQRVSIDHWKLTWSIKGDISRLLDSQGWTRRQEELKSLREIPGAKIRNIEWSPEYVCLPATRERLLEDIVDWVLTGSEKLYWLSGAAGTGKSSVANTVAQHFKQLGLLGASFRFRRDEISLRSPYELFGNLAYQLTFYDEGIRQAIVDVTSERPLESMAETNMPRQLMLEPLQQVQLVQPLVIVIDALDECVTSNSLRGYDSITTMLERFLPELPLFTKILVTSRYECTFAPKYQGQSLVYQQDLTTLAHTREDIQTYFHSRLAQIAFNNKLREWPTLNAKKQLVEHADNLFIWASVACSAIEISHNPPSELSKLLTQSEQTFGNKSKLDELYHRVLTLNLEDKSDKATYNKGFGSTAAAS